MLKVPYDLSDTITKRQESGVMPVFDPPRRQEECLFMIIKEKTMNGLPVLSLSGRLDIFSRNAFKETAEKYTEIGTKGVILDFQGVTFVDSVGLGVLAVVARTFQRVKGRIILVNPQDQVKSLFYEMNLEKMIPMYKTDEEFSQFSEL
jgi:anti-anti-sigma factor